MARSAMAPRVRNGEWNQRGSPARRPELHFAASSVAEALTLGNKRLPTAAHAEEVSWRF